MLKGKKKLTSNCPKQPGLLKKVSGTIVDQLISKLMLLMKFVYVSKQSKFTTFMDKIIKFRYEIKLNNLKLKEHNKMIYFISFSLRNFSFQNFVI